MKYRMSFGALKTTLLVLIILVCIAIFVLDICMLAGVITIDYNNIPVVSVSLAAIILVLIGCLLLLFNSYYKFENNYLHVVFGMFGDKLLYEHIDAIKQNEKTRQITVIYNNPNQADGIQAIKLSLNDVQSDRIADEFRVKCPMVIIESFIPEDKNKKKKK